MTLNEKVYILIPSFLENSFKNYISIFIKK